MKSPERILYRELNRWLARYRVTTEPVGWSGFLKYWGPVVEEYGEWIHGPGHLSEYLAKFHQEKESHDGGAYLDNPGTWAKAFPAWFVDEVEYLDQADEWAEEKEHFDTGFSGPGNYTEKVQAHIASIGRERR